VTPWESRLWVRSLEANIRYDHFYARNFDASDSVLETTDDFSVLTSEAEVSGPAPLKLFGRGTRWIAFIGNTYLPGDQGDSQSGIGFDNFFEVGGGVALIDPSVVDGIVGLSLRASLIIGQDVTGWSAGLALEF
jgi:hypothetical protein